MEIWAIIAIIILLIGIGVFIGLTYWTESGNTVKQQSNILYPFSGSIDPKKTGKNVVLKKSDGKSQIECPVGYEVNVVAAFVEVDDPFGECSPSPGATFRATCGADNDRSSAIKCSSSNQCGSGMTCDDNRCVPQTCSSNSDCSGNPCPVRPGKSCKSSSDCGEGSLMDCIDGTCQVQPGQGQCIFCKDGKCAQAPTCSNLNKSYQNITCASSNTNTICRPRDASAYLAKECDGKQVCDVVWDPSSSKFFGPLPCKVSPKNADYATLPIIAGWSGGKPQQGSKSDPASFKQGYYVHGLYTCVKK